ncbi:MAG: hypothetical protein JWM57_1507 [Phycisphaerales bacterium]|nr:hypothetical protein [Phycisphaerales bacterium]
MGIRTTLNEKPQIAYATVIIAVVAAAALFWFTQTDTTSGIAKRMYYSDDDGKTYFADDTNKVFPFDHNGKQAYRAYVYQASQAPFVGYLARYSESTREQLLQLESKASDPAAAATISQLRNSGVEVKKPGETNWVSQTSKQGQDIMMVTAPGGGAVKGIVP